MGPFERMVEKATSRRLAESLERSWLYHASTGPIVAKILETGIKSGQQGRAAGNTGQVGISFTTEPRVISQFGGWAVAVKRGALERLGTLQDVDYFGAAGTGSGLDEAEVRYIGPNVPTSAIEAVVVSNRPGSWAIKTFRDEFAGTKLYTAAGEKLTEKLFDDIDGTKVFVNPSRDELEAILRTSKTRAARGLRDGKDIFIWTEDDGTHGFVAETLFLHIDTAFYVRRSFNQKNEYVVALSDFSGPTGDRVMDTLKKTPNFARIFKGAKIVEPEYA